MGQKVRVQLENPVNNMIELDRFNPADWTNVPSRNGMSLIFFVWSVFRIVVVGVVGVVIVFCLQNFKVLTDERWQPLTLLLFCLD